MTQEKELLPVAKKIPAWIFVFFSLTWLHMLAQTAGFYQLGSGPISFSANTLFHATAWPLYSFIYSLPVLAVTLPCSLGLPRMRTTAKVLALVASVPVLLLVCSDRMIYELYAFHFNAFVFNLIVTPGGISSLGSGADTYLSITLIALRIAGLQLLFLLLSSAFASGLETLFSGLALRLRHASVLVLGLFLTQGLAYGVSDLNNDGSVLDNAHVYPLFQRIRFRSLASALGFEPVQRSAISASVDTSRLHYPLRDVHFDPVARPPNIVWLVAESLRWDQLTPEIMPNTWAFAGSGQYFSNHYSSGNGTREGLFGMFYGLYGSYWDNFMHARRSPLLMDRLQVLDYQMDLRTSAHFSYPEFDKTLFARVPLAQLHEQGEDSPPWQRDRDNTTALTRFLEQQAGTTPFMTFFFLESTHARYSFPESAVIRRPYLEKVDYARMSKDSLAGSIDQLLNRYTNAAHWIDVQLGRVYRTLERRGLLDNTIVIVTGDHGEEFMEKGAWGHNSSFVEEQTHVPLVMHMPGRSPQTISRTTSHLDIATTLLQSLGAEAETGHYSLGRNLFTPVPRQFINISDWHSIAVLTADMKYRIPYLSIGNHWLPTDHRDRKLQPQAVDRLLATNRDSILRAIRNSSVFSRKPGPLPAEKPDSVVAMTSTGLFINPALMSETGLRNQESGQNMVR